MNGGRHFMIGAATAGFGLWALSAAGADLTAPIILAGAATAGLGALGPDSDHSQSTISRSLPTELLGKGLALLLLPLMFVVMVGVSGGASVAAKVAAPFTPFFRWGLLLAIPSIALMMWSKYATRAFGHRGPTHSLVFALGSAVFVSAACIGFGVAWWFGLLFGLGWLTHIAADSTTKMGVQAVAWPFSDEPTIWPMLGVLMVVGVVLGGVGWLSGWGLERLVPSATAAAVSPSQSTLLANPVLARQRLSEAEPRIAAALVESRLSSNWGGQRTHDLYMGLPAEVGMAQVTVRSITVALMLRDGLWA